MKITMRSTAASADGILIAGMTYDLDAATAQPLVDGGYAQSLEPAKPTKPARPAKPAQEDPPPVGGEGQ